MKNLASSLILTERDAEFDENKPKVPGRIVTTLEKAKTVRPYVEKCVTIARKSLPHEAAAEELATSAERGTDQWREWRKSDQWQQWCEARAPVVAARRRALRLLGDKQAVSILFEEIAPRFADRDGGYTRILRLAAPRLGDAGAQAILEFVGQNDRVTAKAEKPAFEDTEIEDDPVAPAVDDESAEAATETDETAASADESTEASAEAGDAAAADDEEKKKEE